MPEIIPYFMELTQIFQIVSILFGGFAVMWNLTLRHKVDDYVESHSMITTDSRLLEFLGKMAYYHKRVTGILFSIVVIFGIFAVLVS